MATINQKIRLHSIEPSMFFCAYIIRCNLWASGEQHNNVKNDSLNMKIVYNNMTVCKIRGYSQTIKKNDSCYICNEMTLEWTEIWNFFFCLIMMCLYCQTKSSCCLLFHLRSLGALRVIVLLIPCFFITFFFCCEVVGNSFQHFE